MNIFLLLLLSYTISALFAYLSVIMGVYYDSPKDIGYSFPLYPYILNFIFTLIIISPFYHFDENKIKIHNFISNIWYRAFIIGSCVGFFVLTVLASIEAYFMSFIESSDIYSAAHEEGITYVFYQNPILLLLRNILANYYTVSMPIVMFHFISRSFTRKSILLLMTGFVICMAPKILLSISSASRGGIFFGVVNFLFFYTFLRRKLNKRTKLIISTLSLLTIISLFLYSIVITESRFSSRSKDNSYRVVVRYFGEAQVNLYYNIFSASDKINHPYGSRFLPELFGIKAFKSPSERCNYWEKKTKTSEAYFKTFFGDCYIEFSLIGAFVFAVITVLLANTFIFNKPIRFYKLPLVYTYFNVVFTGMFNFMGKDPMQHLFWLLLIGFVFILKKNTKHKNYIHMVKLIISAKRYQRRARICTSIKHNNFTKTSLNEGFITCSNIS